MSTIYYNTQNYNIHSLHSQIMKSISYEYSKYTKAQKISYKFGRLTRSVKNFIFTPQASAMALISFWASFILTYFLITLAINTPLAYIMFGLILLIHTHITFDAVDALIKESMSNYYTIGF
jgi:hypothetical protein